MNNHSPSLYSDVHPELRLRLRQSIDKGCAARGETVVFFRADDIGVPSANFNRLISSFIEHRLPLCLATVPVWATSQRLAELRRVTGRNSSQWCWHQHGRLHRNFEKYGKKQEFGSARNRGELIAQLAKGRSRLRALLGTDFTPVFTPPWNRCNADTLDGLVELDFRAVSRAHNAHPPAPDILPDYQVHVDLHTRKEASPALALDNVLGEIEFGLATGVCGIMIHHQRMNQPAFEFLDLLLTLLQANGCVIPAHFGDLLG